MKYRLIYADPPWKYNARNNGGTLFGKGAPGHYDVMSQAELQALDVGSISADNAALLLWATMPRIPQALEIMASWGFSYKTVGFTWVKTNKHNTKPFFGIGYYTKSNAELCLLGIKGRMKPVTNLVSQIIISPRGEHSQKPVEVRDRIVQLFGDLPRIELFARTLNPGWDSWGNEIEGVNPWTLPTSTI